jgi:alkanesulfonate monooxygenase SsuD/methylene tetrahydromethanopterin reductase-like flavin-dependent oxidoreductase (luciferase family)
MMNTFIGNPATVKKGLQSFLDETQVDEIMVASYVYDNGARIHSYELIGEFFGNGI